MKEFRATGETRPDGAPPDCRAHDSHRCMVWVDVGWMCRTEIAMAGLGDVVPFYPSLKPWDIWPFLQGFLAGTVAWWIGALAGAFTR